MKRIAMTNGSGSWFDKDSAREFNEDTTWDGYNNISRATGSQTEHEVLYATASGKWILHEWSQWTGTIDAWRIISKETAIAWLITNYHAETVKEEIESQVAQMEI